MIGPPADDQILGYALGTLDEDQHKAVAEHIASCPACGRRIEDERARVNELAGVRTSIPVPEIAAPMMRLTVWRELVKAAALVLIGVAIGYLVQGTRAPEVVTVVPYAVNASAPVDSGLVVSEAVDLMM